MQPRLTCLRALSACNAMQPGNCYFCNRSNIFGIVMRENGLYWLTQPSGAWPHQPSGSHHCSAP
jgi:hypothetical protein